MGGRRGSVTEVKASNGKSHSPKRWQVRASLGFDPLTGKRIQAKKTIEGTRKQAEQELERIYREHETGLSFEAGKATFADYAKHWHERRERFGSLSSRTLEAEAAHLRRIIPYIGAVKIRDVSAFTVEAALSKLKENEGGRKPLSGTTMRRYYQTLNAVFKDAVKHDAVLRNPCDKVKAPREDTKEQEALTEEQVHRLVEAINRSVAEEEAAMSAKESRAEARGARFERGAVRGVSRLSCLVMLRLVLATGMRLGEAMALRWCDIGEGYKTVSVRRSVTNKGEFKEPKTRKGRRTITIDTETAQMLAKLRKAQFYALRSIGVTDFKNLAVCCSDVGGHTNIANYGRWLREWQAAAGVDRFHIHQLRHTQATQLLSAHMDVKTVADRLGHSKASTTLNIYAHAIPANDSKAAEMMDSLLNGKPESAQERAAI